MNTDSELLKNLDKLHTTALGALRIKRNLCLENADDVVDWCKNRINSAGCVLKRSGKNYYADAGNCVITINANSYTIITAHNKKKRDS